MQRLEAAKKKY